MGAPSRTRSAHLRMYTDMLAHRELSEEGTKQIVFSYPQSWSHRRLSHGLARVMTKYHM